MRDATAEPPTLDDVAAHLFAAFRPRSDMPSGWPARDVTLGQLRTLFMIRSEGPVSIGRIADSFAIGAPAASGYVERIERHGLIERRHRTDDRRMVDCHLTDAGRQLLDELAGVKSDAVRSALAALTPEERAELDRLLLAIASRTLTGGAEATIELPDDADSTAMPASSRA